MVGKPRIGGKHYTVIGVAPSGFHRVWATNTAAYVPITAAAFDMFGTDDLRGHGAYVARDDRSPSSH